jgi:hypothetical protein
MDKLIDSQLEQAIRKRQIERLIEVQTIGRWLVNITLWLIVGSLSIWSLREDIALWCEYFTWAAVRISLQNNRFAFLGLGLCVANTLSTLIWQSWHILWGFSKSENEQFGQQIAQILAMGNDHPLWRWVIAEKS